jgi:hypothetical protein
MKRLVLILSVALFSCEKTNPTPVDPTPAIDCNCGTIISRSVDGSVTPSGWIYMGENLCSGNITRVYPPSNVQVGDNWCGLEPW